MTLPFRQLAALAIAAGVLPLLSANSEAGDKPAAKNFTITWKKQVLDKAFRSEGVAVADFNKDGKMDIFVGDAWYEAPDWKIHVIRREKPWDPNGYSDSFACFADDFNSDGYSDAIVIPFPGAACKWYENPGKSGGKWKEHILATSACNETPIYVDLFGSGKKVLIMGWQPPGKNNEGELAYFTPGKDPTQLWEKNTISGPSKSGKEVPGTQRFSHGLGHGDINGDGKNDVLVPQGWWEQPEKIDGAPWKFHPASITQNCADMYAFDVDGDGKNDVLSSSAHDYGLWWSQHKPGKDAPEFLRRELFPLPAALAKEPADHRFTDEERAIFAEIGKLRRAQFRGPWRPNVALCRAARALAASWAKKDKDVDHNPKKVAGFDGKILHNLRGVMLAGKFDDSGQLAEVISQKNLAACGLEVGLGVHIGEDKRPVYAILIGDAGAFSLPAQTHALHFVDINGDGQKDLVTGRRWWAHGPKGDADPGDAAVLHWFEARRDRTGFTTFVPHLIDDDSGIGTQFAVIDINGDGIPDIVVSNKRGVFIFEQVRVAGTVRTPASKD